MAVTMTFTEAVSLAHQRGDEEEVNRLLDTQSNVCAEIRARIDSANDSAANLAHQLHAIGVLLDDARAHDMPVEDGDAPLLKGVPIATAALQEWSDR